MKKKRILVADDLPEVLSSLQSALSRDYEVDTATSGMEVISKVSEGNFDGLIIDVDFKVGGIRP
jgi:CheY-like chemotaxis protein